MTELWTSSLVDEAVYRSRVRGCLLGGALGDALGHPIEFSSLERMRAGHGPRGVTGPVFAGDSDVARISDDRAWHAAPPQSGAPEGGLITQASAALTEALDLAGDGSARAERAESLGGEGRIAEQALAIGVHCALAAPSVRDALLLAVNHSGDSDSTGRSPRSPMIWRPKVSAADPPGTRLTRATAPRLWQSEDEAARSGRSEAMPLEPLSQKEIEDRLAELPGWSLDGDRLARSYRLPSHFAATAMVVHIAQVQEELDHHSDLTLGYNTVSLTVNTHTVSAVTERDFALARRIEELAPGHGAN
jgi:4a-hydroxytetrahydrobiopterin dehydratase